MPAVEPAPDGASSVAAQARLVDLLRHGEAAGGACFRGSRDDPLTERGWAQLRVATAAEVESGRAPWDAVVCSPALRCAAFATELAARLGLPLTQVADLRERHFGDWEGRGAAELPEAELAAFWADPIGFSPPGAEDFRVFQRRVCAAWEGILSAPAAHPLVVAHGGVVRVIVGEVLRMPAEALLLLEVPHACRSRIRLPVVAGFPSLVQHGAVPSA